MGYWRTRLVDHGFDVTRREVLGEKRLGFHHPCGIDYELVGVAVTIGRPTRPVRYLRISVCTGPTASPSPSATSDLSVDFMTEGGAGA